LLEEHGLQAASGMLRGEPPSPLNPPTGCRFHTRCDLAEPACAQEHPVLEPASAVHEVRCLRWETAQAAASTL
jgi:oligopeptide/dipeptide ABC transporter ATP-binding protein